MANHIPYRHHDEPQRPQGEPQSLNFSLNAIRQLDGLYCLNDLHRMAGGKQKHSPYEFLRSEVGKALLDELEREFKGSKIPDPYIIRVIGKGKPQGTYVCRELVYAYANWISPAFYLKVIRVFDRVATGETNYTSKLNALCRELMDITQLLTFCGRNLAIQGKQTKPAIQKKINDVMAIIQPQLPLGGNV